MNITRFSFRLFLAATLAGFFSAAADSVSGKVRDPQGAPVANAEITLFDRNSGNLQKTTSSATGDYSFPNVAPGTYLLEAQASGAALSISEDITVAGATSRDLTLALARPTVRVLVTATYTPLSEQEVARVIDVVDREDMNLRNEFAISEAVRNVAGVRVRQLEGPGSFTSIQTRGMRSHDTAVLIDGLRFRDAGAPQADATAFFEDMNVVDTSRIEYLRGSGSTLYGSNAIGGVININSGQGGGPLRASVRTEGGGLGMMRGVINAGGGAASDRLVYSGGFSHLNVVNGIRDSFPYRNTGGQVFGKFKLTPKMSLSGRLWGADAFLRSSTGPAFTPAITANFPAMGPVRAVPLAESQVALYASQKPFSAGNATFIPSIADPDGSRVSSFLTSAAIFTHEITSGTSYRLSYQGVDSNRAYWNGPAGTSGFEPLTSQVSRFDGRTDTAQARLDSHIGDLHLVTLGYEFERENYLNREGGIGTAPPDARISIDQFSHSAFGQEQLRLAGGRLQIALSGRIQTFDLQNLKISGVQNPYSGVKIENPENAYTGDVSVAYFFRRSETKLRAHAGNAYRAPSPFERFGASYFSGFYGFYGDPRLRPEKSRAFDGGIDQWLLNAKVRLSATFFYTDLRETVIFDFANFPPNDPFGRFGGYRNSRGGGISRGVELSTQLSLDSRTSIQANYTYTNADQRTPTIGRDFFEVPWTSKHIFTATATRWITPRFHVNFDWFVASEYSYSPFGALGRRLIFSGPNKTDFVASYRIPVGEQRSVEIYGKLENAFDVRYFEGGSTTPGIWGIGGLKFNF